MPCYHPLWAWSVGKLPNGKDNIVFRPPKRGKGVFMQLPCGSCVGCALERSRQWAIRCVHESQLHDSNCFITLTYSPQFLPDYGSLVKEHFVLFMKRFRKSIYPIKIRFFQCGEYGENGSRPHYHALIFGYGFPDRVLHSERKGVRLYVSELLSKLWPWGFSSCGDITLESAAYVARYCLKKVKSNAQVGEMDADNFSGRIPEYVNMSRGGRTGRGLAYGWFVDFKSDVFPCDNVVIKGKMGKPPRYYDKLLEVDNLVEYASIKEGRRVKALANVADNTPERLKVKEVCCKSKISLLKRGYENEI